jgi:uncharacterized membrane protein
MGILKGWNMTKRMQGIILIIIGLALAVISLLADQLGIGGTPGIGLRQIVGAVAGILVVAGGIWRGWYNPGQKK